MAAYYACKHFDASLFQGEDNINLLLFCNNDINMRIEF